MTALSAPGCSYALLADGATITIRPARPDDFEQVKRLHDEMSPDNLYLRFFSLSRNAGEQEARRVTRADVLLGALLGFLGDELVGVASYEPIGQPGTAEVAFAVADNMHHRGGGHAAARAPGVAGPGPRRAGLHCRHTAGEHRHAARVRRRRG